MNASVASGAATSHWLTRARVAIGAGLLFGVLFLLGRSLLHLNGSRPVVLLFSDGGMLMGIVSLVAAVIVACLGARVAACGDFSRGMRAVALGVALWAMLGGNMDQWLTARNTVPGAASSAAFAPLVAELAGWGVVFLAAAASLGGLRRATPSGDALSPGANGSFLLALGITSAVAAGLMLVLVGPRLAWTLRGQVYFAAAVAYWAAALVAHRATQCDDPRGYWPAPFVVGLAGLLWAMVRPGFGGAYGNINIIPPNGLARALPVEMVSVGILGALTGLRAALRKGA